MAETNSWTGVIHRNMQGVNLTYEGERKYALWLSEIYPKEPIFIAKKHYLIINKQMWFAGRLDLLETLCAKREDNSNTEVWLREIYVDQKCTPLNFQLMKETSNELETISN